VRLDGLGPKRLGEPKTPIAHEGRDSTPSRKGTHLGNLKPKRDE
jgi:hypothetical protein